MATIQMIEHLEIDGMSSEDSEGEVGTHRTFKIKKLPWRSQELTTFLHRVDELPTKNAQNGILRRRTVHRFRLIKDIESVSRSPVERLCENLYNGEWLKGQDDRNRKRLGVVDSPFIIPRIDDYVI
jgi:hypothetical protein